MLFVYSYINHGIEKLHGYIEHLVLEVWCKATGNFSTSQLHPSFTPIVEKNNKYLKDPITNIYTLFAKLSQADKDAIADGFTRNNDIEGICNGTVEPFRFADIEIIDKDLAAALNDFFKSMYTNVLKQSAVKKECGDLDEHYDSFETTNKTGKCPFCGLNDIKSPLVRVRDAYDHYLPKDIYPFNSVNFKNLVPACNTCNSSYKLANDPVFNKKLNKKRRAFYPFAAAKPDIQIAVQVKGLDFNDPRKNDIGLAIQSATHQEELDSWREVYGMDERYLDKCKSEDAKLWLQQATDDIRNYGFDPAAFFSNYLNARKNQPFYLEYNFIRIPFLESCNATGLIK